MIAYPRVSLARDERAYHAPLTLRDAQKALAARAKARSRYDARSREFRNTYSFDFCLPSCLREISSTQIDRAISAWGPAAKLRDIFDAYGAEIKQPERPKETEEVAPQSENPSEDAEVHGGSGNSGECDAPSASKSQEERKNSQPATSGAGSFAGSEFTQCGDRDVETHVKQQALEDASQDEPGDAGKGIPPSGEQLEDSDNLETESPGDTRESDEASEGKTDKGKSSGRVGTEDSPDDSATTPRAGYLSQRPEEENKVEVVEIEPEARPNPSQEAGVRIGLRQAPGFGGVYCSEQDAKTAKKAAKRQVAKLARSLERLFKALDKDVQGDASPRVAPKKLVRELASRRNSLSKAKREELAPSVCLLLCDVSGSCSAVCKELLGACLALAEILPDKYMTIAHSNGVMYEEDRHRTILALVAEKRLKACVAFGDWDAGAQYRLIAERCQLVWLDSYACRLGGVHPASAALRGDANSWRVQPIAWFQGVHDVVTTEIALRLAARK